MHVSSAQVDTAGARRSWHIHKDTSRKAILGGFGCRLHLIVRHKPPRRLCWTDAILRHCLFHTDMMSVSELLQASPPCALPASVALPCQPARAWPACACRLNQMVTFAFDHAITAFCCGDAQLRSLAIDTASNSSAIWSHAPNLAILHAAPYDAPPASHI